MPVIGIDKLIDFFLQNYLTNGLTILDVGSGNGFACNFFLNKCIPTALDIKEIYSNKFKTVKMDIMQYKPEKKFDAIWCAHLLEHMPNLNNAIIKILSFSKEGSPMAFIVPPRKDALVGGHINLFTAGSLCYNIILSGQDLSKASCIIYEYNIALFWNKKQAILPKLKMNLGDIESLSAFFPLNVYQGIDGMMGWKNIRAEKFNL